MMKERMSADRSDGAEVGNSIDAGNENAVTISIDCSNNSSDVEDVEASFGLNESDESEESEMEKNGRISEESNLNYDDEELEKQVHDLSTQETSNSASIALLLQLHHLGPTIPGEGTEMATTFYKYRDFSDVTEKDVQKETIDSGSPNQRRAPKHSRASAERFPLKLYAILAQKEFQEIIAWMPHGRSWKVLKPRLFESLVMPIFFQCGNYHSFSRLVNAWSFRRITSGVDSGSYYHELFLRGKPYLQKHMRRLPKSHKKQPMRTEDEPDFYTMDKEKPLPQCHGNSSGNYFTNLYPTPFGMVSGAALMRMPIPIQIQMPVPIPWQHRYPAIAGSNGWSPGGMNDDHDTGEFPLGHGADGMVSQNMHTMGMPMGNASAFSSSRSSGINSIMESGGMGGNDMGDGIETGININTIEGREMGIESTVAGQEAFDIEDPITKDGSMGL